MDKQRTEIAENSEKRQDIIRSAYKVFYQHGFHASGVDRLLADSGISKRTMYKYFRSKEDLITATIGYYAAHVGAEAAAALQKMPDDPRQKILALFDWRREILEAGDFSGCFATNAKLEYQGKHKGIEDACTAFHTGIENLLADLCAAAGLATPKIAARQLMILMEGTIVYGQALGDADIALQARHAAATLLDAFAKQPH